MDEKKRETFDRCIAEGHDNQLSILKSDRCGCYYCGNVFSARDIVDWDERDGKAQALCPVCGMAGVFGDASGIEIDEEFTKELVEYARTVVLPGVAFQDIKRFCDLYSQGRINHSEQSETMYLSYGMALGFQGRDDSHLMAAIQLIAFGGEFINADPEMAISILKRPFFANDTAALTMLASLYGSHKGKEKEATQDKHAYEYAYKATLLGSLLGRCYLYDYVYEGTGCKKDPIFATNLLFAVLDDVYDATRGSRDFSNPELFEYFARLGDDYIENENPSPRDAVRYYMLADYFAAEVNTPFYDNVRKELAKDLEEAKEKFGSFDGPMMMDEHTFYDTFVDFQRPSIPLQVSRIEYNDTLQVLSLTIAPTTEFILLDASSASYRKAYHEEITFALNGVLHTDLPEGPFSFSSIYFDATENGSRVSFFYGYGEDMLVGTISFQKMEESDKEEQGD